MVGSLTPPSILKRRLPGYLRCRLGVRGDDVAHGGCFGDAEQPDQAERVGGDRCLVEDAVLPELPEGDPGWDGDAQAPHANWRAGWGEPTCCSLQGIRG